MLQIHFDAAAAVLPVEEVVVAAMNMNERRPERSATKATSAPDLLHQHDDDESPRVRNTAVSRDEGWSLFDNIVTLPPSPDECRKVVRQSTVRYRCYTPLLNLIDNRIQ